MKRSVAALMLVPFAFGLSACGGDDEPSKDASKQTVSRSDASKSSASSTSSGSPSSTAAPALAPGCG